MKKNMKSILLIALLFLSTVSFSQTKPHKHLSTASEAFAIIDIEKNYVFTFDNFEIIKWDLKTGQPIANKEYQTLIGKPNCYLSAMRSDIHKNSCIITQSEGGSFLINLNNFTAIPWPYGGMFTDDGLVAYQLPDNNKKKLTYIRYVFNPKDMTHKKDDREKVKYKEEGYNYWYDTTYYINDNSNKGKSVYTVINKHTNKKLSGEEKETYLSQIIFSRGYSEGFFTKHNYKREGSHRQDFEFTKKKKKNGLDNKQGKFLEFSKKTNLIYALEFDENQSYITTYNTENNYQFTKFIELIKFDGLTQEEELILKARRGEIEKGKALADKEAAEKYSPEKILQRKLNNIKGTYIYNTTTKGIYYIVPSKPIYENHLVRLDAIHHDKSQNSEVYETMEKLEDSKAYRRAKGHSACGVCGGNGYTVKSGKTTIADLEYTTGKKLVQTTTSKYGCENCGGCGLIPTTLVDLNFLFIND